MPEPKSELSLRDFYDKLFELEGRIEKKIDTLRGAVITWRALVGIALVILPSITAALYGVLQYHESRQHLGTVTREEFVDRLQKIEQQQGRLNDQLEKFNDNVQANSRAIERLSATIQMAFEVKLPPDDGGAP